MKITNLETLAIHGDNSQKTAGLPVTSPICQSSTFTVPIGEQCPDLSGQLIYTRHDNPNFLEVESVVSALERAKQTVLFASGMAAAAAVVWSMVKPGSRVIVHEDVYGTMRTMFKDLASKVPFDLSFVDLTTDAGWGVVITSRPDLVWMETISNPKNQVPNISALATLVHRDGGRLVVDNTFASPIFCQPLTLGADVVVHSATKYLCGHSDVVLGTVSTGDDCLNAKLREQRFVMGAVPDPFAAWLLARGLKTLPVRMRQHAHNALAVAVELNRLRLETSRKVRSVTYPGLASYRELSIMNAQFRGGFGGMVYVELNADLAGVCRFLGALEIFQLAVSLGGVESLVNHPHSMTHSFISQEERDALRITEQGIRLSVGLEHHLDLSADLHQALAKI